MLKGKFPYKAFFQVALISVYPVFSLFSRNLCEVFWHEFFVVSGIFLLFGMICFIGSLFLLGNNEKAGVFSSCLLFIFFYFMPVARYLSRFNVMAYHIFRVRYLFILSFVFLIVLFLLLRKSFRQKYFFSRFFIIPYLVLFLFFLLQIFVSEKPTSHVVHNFSEYNCSEDNSGAILPNIFYIIVDAHVSQKTMKNFYGFDNESFIKFLKEKGFYIPRKAYSNYNSTDRSIPSSLNSIHLEQPYDITVARSMMSHNAVVRFLKSRGYICKNIPSSEGISRFLLSFNKEFSFSIFSDFTTYLLDTTLLEVFGWSRYLTEEKKRRWIEYQLAKIKELAGSRDRQFVFAHIMCPHPPFVFDENGKPRFYEGDDFWNDAYVHHIKYIDSRIKEVITHILEVSSTPPVIIVQGDHGTSRYVVGQSQEKYERFVYFRDKFADGFFDEEIRQELSGVEEHFGILNAYYLPNNGQESLYDTISPVNSFRVIFSRYFNLAIELLPDSSYIVRKEKFIEVDRLFKNV